MLAMYETDITKRELKMKLVSFPYTYTLDSEYLRYIYA